MTFRSLGLQRRSEAKMGLRNCLLYINFRLRYLVEPFALVKTGFFFKHNIKGTVSRDGFGF
jgi:hypothetical protein